MKRERERKKEKKSFMALPVAVALIGGAHFRGEMATLAAAPVWNS